MNVTEKLEVIKHIKLGTNEIIYYPYNGGRDPLPLRPISSFELDQCFYNGLKFAPEKIADLVIKLRMGIIKEDRNINVSNNGYAKLLEFYNTVNYWVVYYSMKDFQDDSFSSPNYNEINNFPRGFYIVRKMSEVHEIAEFVLNTSYKTEEVIKEIFTDEMGREVAYIVYYLNTPLFNIKDITKLQRDYLIYAKGHLTKIMRGKAKKDRYIISNETMTMEEFRSRFV